MKNKPPVFRNIARDSQGEGFQLKTDDWHVHEVRGDGRALDGDAVSLGGGSPIDSASPRWSLATANFTQDWSNTGLITANDDWANVPAIVGYLGDDASTTAADRDPRLITAAGSTGAVDVIANATLTTINNGGVAEFQITNPTIALQGSGTADAPCIVLYLDSTGRENIRLTCNIRDLDSTTAGTPPVEENSVQQLNIQYRTDGGTWINVPLGYFADVTGLGATMVTAVDLLLPAAAANSGTLEIRIMTTNATGNDEWVGIDDIVVSSTPIGAPQPGTLSIDNVSMAEGNSATTSFTFTVTRTGGDDGAVSATWTVGFPGGAGSADASDIASALTGTVNFADGEITKSITVEVVGDTVFEDAETFTVTLSAAGGGATIGTAIGTGTIQNDDAAPQPGSISIGDVSLAEGNSGTTAFVFTVTRSGGSDGAVGATWTLDQSGGVFADAVDFAPGQPTTGTVSFANGETSQTITILVQGDVTFEADELFNVTLSNATGGVALNNVTGTGEIFNDDGAPPGELSINDVSLAEGNSGATAFTFTVTRANGSAGAVTADYIVNLPGDPDASGPDFVSGQGFTGQVSFADGQTSQTITLNVQGDADFEGDEDFTVTLSNATGGATIADGTGAGTIVNDDPAPVGSFTVNDVILAEGNSGTTSFIFTVTRTGGTAGTVTVNYATADDSATAGSDYTATSGLLTFLDGETSKQVIVQVTGETAFENNETFFLNLTNPTGGATILDAQGVGTINNDDAAPAPGSVSVADFSIVEGNAGTSILTFTLTRTGGTAAFDVNFATSNGGDPTHASATAGSDYVANSGTVSFGIGVNTQTVQITINGDVAPELSEEFTLTLSNATNGATISDAIAIGTITNDDTAPSNFNLLTQNFDAYNGTGFAPVPATGQLDSDIYIASGFDDPTNPSVAFGGTVTTGDLARGLISVPQTTGGIYALDQGSGDHAFWVQPGANDFTPGDFTIRITNSSGLSADTFAVAYDLLVLNDQGRSNSFNLSYSTDGTTWVALTAFNYTSPDAADALGVQTFLRSGQFTTASSVAAGGFLYLRLTGDDVAGSGSRDEFGIDNFTVGAVVGAASPTVTVSDVSVNEAAGTMTFTVTRSNLVGGAFSVNYATADGTALAGSDYVSTSGTLNFADNQTSATVTVTINDDGAPELDETLLLNLSGATGGALITDAQGVGTIVNDDGTPIQVSINDVSISEGNSGTQILTFTVTRTGGTGAFDVNFGTANDTATAGSDYVASSGTLNFGAGVNSQTVQITINGDTTPEQTEQFFVNLTNPTNGAVVVDGQGVGTIINDEGQFIHDIQGTSYFSPILAGEGITSFNVASTAFVTVTAIITAIDNVGPRQGFYIQEEITDWDGNTFTSEGIFVMTRNDANVGTAVSGVAVGDLVTVTARVMEYQGFTTNMPITALVNASSIVVGTHNNPMPTFLLDANVHIPSAIFTGVTPDYTDSSDGVGDTFDASLYGLSFWETVEGMLVTIPDMVVADGFTSGSATQPFMQAYSAVHADADQINSRGGYTIAGDPPNSPPDTANTEDGTSNGGRVVHDGDINPDIIELDWTGFADNAPAGLSTGASMGDLLGDVTGIIDFDFTDRKLFVTDMEPGGWVDTTPTTETTLLGGDERSLTVATFNVENLDPTDPLAKFQGLANAIANNLNTPDIICIEEMQDNNGAGGGGGVDASTSWNMLVTALNAATGKHYQWVDQDPVSNAEGGEQEGNIRVGFLYDTDRVQLGDLDANASLSDRRKYTDRIGDGVRDANDLIAFDDSMLGSEINTTDWTTTRKSLLGEFHFNGNTVYVTANHWPSKGGSGDFWQFNQNLASGQPANSDWAQRNAIANDVYSMLNMIQSANANAGIVSGGDYNDFYFYRPLEVMTGYVLPDGSVRSGGARFDNLTLTLPEAERYTYAFDGRSQAIDHIVVNGLLSAVATYDVVHLNSGFNDSVVTLSDHDPGVATFDFRSFSEFLQGAAGGDTIEGFGGNDGIVGHGGNDTLSGDAGNDSLHGGVGNDDLRGGADNDFLSGGDNEDALQGNDGNDTLLGGAGNDLLNGGIGTNVMYGGTGNDIYLVASSSDYIVELAGEGTDILYTSVDFTLSTGSEIEILSAGDFGGTFNVNLTGNERNDIIWGNAGVNLLTGGVGNDNLHGFAGNDGLLGGDGDDFIDGGDNDDSLHGQDGTDTLIGNNGNDFLSGGVGNDMMYGGAGNDTYIADAGDYIVEAAGAGTDIVYATQSFTLSAGSEIELLAAGGTGAINLTGNELGNTLQGNGDANVLDGKGGNDVLIGGAGADTFAFTTAIGGGHYDTIADFQQGVDKIGLSASVFTAAGGLGTLNANAFVIGTAAGDGSDRIIYNSTTGQLFYDADGTGGTAAVMFATLSPGLALTASDFQVI